MQARRPELPSAIRRSSVVLFTITIALAMHARPARSQEPTAPQPELRVDAFTPRPTDVQLGAGLEIPFGWYTRLGAIVGGGVANENAITVGSGRADAIVRFLLDPFRETRWGLSVGGGVSVRYDPVRHWREYLAVVADFEGPQKGPVMPSFQVGLGGGVRVGVGLRRAVSGRR